MIKCNRCGKMTPAGAFCQSCGTPLAGMVENESSQSSPMMSYQDQLEVPAWLESLRAGERPAAPANNPINTSFSPSELIDEGSLPSWMSSKPSDARGNTVTNAPQSTYSAPFPDQSSDFEEGSSTGFQAQSLIDEKSLPSWMQAGNPGSSSPTNGEGLSAASLVQQDNLPDWMKTLQPQSAPPRGNPGQGNQPAQGAAAFPSSGQPAPAPSSVTSGFAARDLIDQQSLPSWMKPQNERTNDNSGSFPFNQNQNQTGQSGSTGAQAAFSASSLLDVDALPSWLREGSQNSSQYPRINANASGSAPQAGQNNGQGAWLAAQPSNTGWPAAQPSNAAWPGTGPTGPPAQVSGQAPSANSMTPSDGGALSASSFIDNSSLPSWLRSGQSTDMPSAQPTTPPGSQAGSYTMPPRGENMRVPSRPRGEVNPTDTSEMAANVFASMLGVASTAPNYPASNQQQNPSRQSGVYGQSNQSSVNNNYGPASQNAYGQSGQSAPSSYSYGQMDQPGQGQTNSYPQWVQPPTSQPQANMSGGLNPGTMPNTPTGMGGGNAFPQNYGAGNSLSGMSGSYNNTNYPGNAQGQMNSALGANSGMSGMGNSQPLNGSSSLGGSNSYFGNSAQSMSNSSAQSSSSDGAGELKNKKRGLFEAIREWLSR